MITFNSASTIEFVFLSDYYRAIKIARIFYVLTFHFPLYIFCGFDDAFSIFVRLSYDIAPNLRQEIFLMNDIREV